MSVTRLKRKHRKNIARANNKQHIIKELLRTPVLKNVDLDELKSRFTTNGAAAPAAKATESADNNATFDAADAVTKPVNADGQSGEHPKPEIAL